MDSSHQSPPPNSDPSSVAQLRRDQLIDRQTLALERLAVVSDPTYRPKQRLAAKLVGLILAGSAVVLAGYEFVRFVIEAHEHRTMIDNWVEAARELYEIEGNAEAATELLGNAAEMDPQSAAVVKLSAYIDGMQTVESLINLDRPLSKEDVSRYARAAGQAVMLERVDPDSTDWAVLRGQLAIVANEPVRARRYLERAIELDPMNAFAVMRMALVHRTLALAAVDELTRAAELKSCSELLKEALAMNPRSKWTLLWMGTLALEQAHDPVLARVHFSSAIEIDPRFANAHHSLGEAAVSLEEWSVAEKCYVRALEIRPDLAASLTGLAYVYGARDLYEIGLRYARKATVADPGSLGAWRMRGRLAREVAKEVAQIQDDSSSKDALEEAILAYTNALDLDPRNGDAYIERSALYQQASQLTEAGNDARNAVLFAPLDPYAWNALAKVQAQAGFHREASQSFGEVVKLEVRFDEAYLGRAQAEAVLGEFAAATSDFDLALEHSTDEMRTDILLARGKFRASRTEYESALADCIAARTKDERLFEAWIAEAEVLKSMGRFDDSRAAARRALMLRPNDANAQSLEKSEDVNPVAPPT